MIPVIIYEHFHALSTLCVLLTTCITVKTNTKQAHTTITIFIQLAIKIFNQAKTFILHLLKVVTVCMLLLIAATRKLS